jgi:glycosyltransferase involved in cell wall biosynthesis
MINSVCYTFPLVSICIPTWNGEQFIEHTIRSLLDQTYRNIEIIILDNLSTDNTAKICRNFQIKDNRVRFIIDSEKSGDPEGHIRVAKYASGDYIVLACDDDVYCPNYIEVLISILQRYPSAGFAYSNYKFIDTEGKISESFLKDKYLFKAKNSNFKNFIFYLLNRNPIPISFALYRRKIYQNALDYFYRPTQGNGDHDNLLVLKALSLASAASTHETLFFYRLKDRSKQLPQTRGFRNIFNQLKHQACVFYIIMVIISESDFRGIRLLIAHLINAISLIKYSIFERVFLRVRKILNF